MATQQKFQYRRLNKDDCIFLFIDHQTGLCGLVRDFSPDEFRNNVAALLKVAKYFEVPSVITTSFEQGPNGPIVQEVKDALPDAPYIARPGQINAMDNEEFVKAIQDSKKKQVVISGVLTEICVAFPALSLVEQGYDVFVVTDASGTFNECTREASHKRMAAAGVQLLNWVAVAAELHRDWRNDIEGFGKIWADHVPAYKLVVDSYAQNRKE